MQKTSNYGLNKPDGSDTVDISVLNQNMDTIDVKLKSNADDTEALEGKVSSHLADYTNFKNSKGQANGLASLGSDGKVPSTQLPIISPVEYGRYQAEWELDDAVLNNAYKDINDTFTLSETTINTIINSTTSYRQVYNNYGAGTRLDGAYVDFDEIDYIEVLIYEVLGKPSSIRMTIFDETLGSIVATSTIPIGTASVFNRFTLSSPLKGIRGHVLQIRFDSFGSDSSNGYLFQEATGVSNLVTEIFSSEANSTWKFLWASPTQSIQLKLGVVHLNLTGTIIKTIAHQGLKKWGNIKWTQNLPTNSSVKCDVLKSDGTTVLKSNITSLLDLSDIDIGTNPIIKVRWTLSRNSISDTSPTIKDVSVTWEGASEMIQPTKPMNANAATGTNPGIYYTLLDLNNGKGKLNKVVLCNANAGNASMYLRITCDGNGFDYGSPKTGNLAVGRVESGSTNASYSIEYFPDIYFKQSLKIEYRLDYPNGVIYASCDYALV